MEEEKKEVAEESEVKEEKQDENKDNIVNLSEILTACLEFDNEPSDENQQDIDLLLAALQIRSYIPLTEKQLILMRVIDKVSDELDVAGKAVYTEMATMIHGLLPYAVNLNNDLKELAVQYGVYDTLAMHGVFDYILSFCVKDFGLLDSMILNSLNFHDLERITRTATLFDDAAYEKWAKMISDVKTTLTPEILADIKAIAVEGSPEWKTFKDTVADKALGEALEKSVDRVTKGLEKEEEKKDDKGGSEA